MVVHTRFVAPVPDELALDKVGPILCAGITVYDPLVHWKAGSDGVKRVGVVGGGGLGMMAIKIAKAMGCEVTAVTRSTAKVDELKHAGADKVSESSFDRKGWEQRDSGGGERAGEPSWGRASDGKNPTRASADRRFPERGGLW